MAKPPPVVLLRSFPPDDPLLIAVVNAENALHALSIEVHYLSCGDVVGRGRKAE
jgi:hypothetical protein